MMVNRILPWLDTALKAITSSQFMPWNLFLALIPLFLSLWLFRKSNRANLFWWLVFLIFMAFLPNAPYVLTDIIHLFKRVNYGYSIWILTLVIVPQYIIFILLGVQAYTISIMRMGVYLYHQGLKKSITIAEIITHALCAIGIYLGRFKRFNSWDFVAQPQDLARSVVNDLTTKQPLLVILITFVVLVVIYWIMKQVNLGLALRVKQKHLQVKT
jgi:uncharacterized membrane protein